MVNHQSTQVLTIKSIHHPQQEEMQNPQQLKSIYSQQLKIHYPQ